MTDFAGKHGLIVGVANKRSIAWAIAQAVARRGARLALTYQGRFEEHVNELSQGLEQPPLVLPCDVSSDAEIDAVFAKVDQEFGGLDFVVHGAAFAPREELEAPFVEHHARRLPDRAGHLGLLADRARRAAALPLMEKRGGGAVVTLTYLGSERVFPNYNVMGVAKAALEATVRYLAADVGPKNIRVNAVSAGPIKTLAAAGIKGFSSILHVYPERAPLRRNVETAEVAEAAAFLLSDAGKGITGEVLHGRRRIPRHGHVAAGPSRAAPYASCTCEAARSSGDRLAALRRLCLRSRACASPCPDTCGCRPWRAATS